MTENLNFAAGAIDDVRQGELEATADDWAEYNEWLDAVEADFDDDDDFDDDGAHVGYHAEDCDCDQCAFGDDENTDYGYFDDEDAEYDEYDDYSDAFDAYAGYDEY